MPYAIQNINIVQLQNKIKMLNTKNSNNSLYSWTDKKISLSDKLYTFTFNILPKYEQSIDRHSGYMVGKLQDDQF